MRYDDLDHFLDKGRGALAKGPIALLFAEDDVEVETTIRHHQFAGFRELIVFAPPEIRIAASLERNLHRISYPTLGPDALTRAVNRIIPVAAGQWLYYCFNAEYLFFPFCETRSVADMLAFHTEERRDAMLAYVIDLYAGDLTSHPNAVSLETAYLDKAGYYALGRQRAGEVKDRQLDFYGGLRWRYEEHVPWEKRKIDRIALFKAQKGLELLEDHTFNEPEYNTYSCPWHHNLTVAICSFRTAKALRANPGSRDAIHNFRWHNSVPFEWTPNQLLNLGLMEPGQWF